MKIDHNNPRYKTAHKNMSEKSMPLTKIKDIKNVEDFLLHGFKQGRRNYTIFQVGKATLLRASDVLKLKYNDIFDRNDDIRENAFTIDKKTKKHNTLYLKPIHDDLLIYQLYLNKHNIKSNWLFPSSDDYSRHITRKQFYKIMRKTGDYLGLHLNTHVMRKTGALEVYRQTNDIALVQHLLNHSSVAMTLRYLGLNNKLVTHKLDNVHFY